MSTTLIQVDVTVTDKKGNIVTNLKPEDFEVYENGKKQEISNFSFVSTCSETAPIENAAAPSNSGNKNNKIRIPIPPVKLKAEQVRRTYALVVDDLGLSFESVRHVQQSLKKFVGEQMREGDLVAIIRTGIGIGSLQSFTSDKRLLFAAIDKIRWNSQGRGGIGIFDPIQKDIKEEIQARSKSGEAVQGSDTDKAFQEQIDQFRRDSFSVGTLGALNYVIRGMRDLPGRKSVMLLSEGFRLTSGGAPNRVFDQMRLLADLANRSSVVFYTLDPRGLQNPGMAFADEDITSVVPTDPGAGRLDSDPRDARTTVFRETQMSLRYLVGETGGVPFVNQNNLNKGMQRAIDDQSGYYLLGYEPDEATFDPKKNKFNRLVVKLTRPDLKIRYRSGFFGIADEKLRQTAQTPRQKLAAALVSPFGAGEVNLNLYSIFYNDNQDRSFIRSLVYIDTKDLTFTSDADGFYQVKFDIIAMIFDASGAAAGNSINSHTLKFTKEQFAKIQEKGIIYDLPVPIIKSGAYQFRVALQDAATGKIGAVSQFIEIPNLAKKKKLTLSNLIVKQYSPEEWKKISLGQNNSSNSSNNSALLDTVTRKFKPGTIFTYSFIVYNAKADSVQKPQLQLQARLFHNGKMILEGSPSAIDVNGQTDLRRIEVSKAVTLGTNLQPGDYALQIIVSDGLAKEKKQIASQSIDFEIVN
ncbi:MAG TPA: VWA domain-containing protein [Pyrinomonadaceae bacterium]|nr:VWA domain-containing protein [Pyrinomonadaceae bacterium]